MFHRIELSQLSRRLSCIAPLYHYEKCCLSCLSGTSLTNVLALPCCRVGASLSVAVYCNEGSERQAVQYCNVSLSVGGHCAHATPDSTTRDRGRCASKRPSAVPLLPLSALGHGCQRFVNRCFGQRRTVDSSRAFLSMFSHLRALEAGQHWSWWQSDRMLLRHIRRMNGGWYWGDQIGVSALSFLSIPISRRPSQKIKMFCY